jgi:hypothetical protein
VTDDAATLIDLVTAAFEDAAGNVVLKPVIDAVAEEIGNLSSNASLVAVGCRCISSLGPRMSSGLEHADFLIRWALFTVHVADEDFLRAATVLAGARLDSESLSDDEKVRG